jgi:ABC-2 type transport system permease protein
MSRTITVAVSEFLTLVRTKAFIIGVILMPVFMIGAVVFQKLTEDRLDTTDRRVAIVDHTGAIVPLVKAAADALNQRAIDAGGTQRSPRFFVESVTPSPRSAADQRIDLSARVRSGELFAFVEIPADIINPDARPPARIEYHSDHPSYDTLPRFLGAIIGRAVLALRFRSASLDPALIDKLTKTPELANQGLFERDAAGRVLEAQQIDKLRAMAVPAGFMFLMFIVVMTSSPQLLNTVMEEKMSRISEVLISSVTPFELMMGKLLGSATVSLVLAVVYVAGAYRVASHYGYADAISPPMLGWFAVFLVCAVLLFGSIFISIGAACTDIKDAQGMMTPAMLLIMLPVFTWTAVLRAPDSAFAVGISMFPPATPFTMLLRIALRPAPPLWQILLSLALVGLTVVLAVWAAGKIFRAGILMTGKSATVTEMLRWVKAS